MAESFADATAVASLGGARYGVHLSQDWTVMGKPNGGYLMAVMARAAEAHLRSIGVMHPYPVAASSIYATVPDCGPATCEVQVLRTGRSASQVLVHVLSDEQVVVSAQFTFGGLDHDEHPRYSVLEAIDVATFEDCVRLPAINQHGLHVAILEGSEQRLDRSTMAFARGEVGDVGELRGWVRFDDGTEFDPFSLLFAGDCFPPATFNLGSIGWVPTLQLTVYLRALPAPGPLKVRQSITVVHGRLVDEVCHIVDSEGILVAHATQLAQARFA